ncbi:MAG TPA: filamentous hemagglutinin N-terminal domain-containing protein, partial [Stellaceae bacterium]|nr:filamentous hemagglutinin N-terminal domain-containing protein [Stellaceae bacterium]
MAGSATISTAGATTQITTNSQRTIINWTGVSLKPGEIMSFVQPSAGAATLNRVTGPDPSVLLGTLSSNGQVLLINPNGIVVGQGARIDTAGFVASTLDVPDTAFMSGGSLKFTGTSTASIQNFGTINATMGDAVLVAQGIIAPTGGSVSGSTFLLTQGALTAATPQSGTLTVELFGTVATLSGSAIAGQAVQLASVGNHIGGTAHVTTGATPL